MARGKITKRSIDVLIASSENDILWDDSIRGFGAKRTKSGAVSYVLQFRMGGRESKTRRYTIGSHGSAFGARRPLTNAQPGDVYPGGQGFVVREDGGARALEAMTWGFPVRLKHMKATSKPKPVNNARDDKLMSFWRTWFTNPAQRCLIPFTAFAEAEGEKGRMTQTWISPTDQPLAACAGLWRPSDEWGDCYTMVMVDATKELFDVHDRMPVILQAADHDRWLRAEPADAMMLVTQYPAERLAVERTDIPWFSRKPPTGSPTLF